MTRNLMRVAAAVALLGGYGGQSFAQASDGWDGETEAKVRGAREAQEKEQRAQHQRRAELRQARIRAEVEAQQRQVAEYEMLGNGIEPTTGRPLSRQRRRALERQGYRFASAGEAGTAATVKQGAVHEHATAESGDAQTPVPSSRERK